MATHNVNGHQPNGVVTNGTLPKNPGSYAKKFKLPAHFIGGNHLGTAKAGPVKDFVAENDGHTVIENVRLQRSGYHK